jgi:hypothetical protein
MKPYQSSVLLAKHDPDTIYVVKTRKVLHGVVVDMGSDVQGLEIGQIVSFTPRKYREINVDGKDMYLVSKYFIEYGEISCT